MELEIIKAIADWSDCYKSGKPLINPTGIVVHSTGADNEYLRRYCNNEQALGKNKYGNFWGTGSSTEQADRGIPHAAIGLDINQNIAIAQVMPFNMRCWGCGSGKNGSYNISHLQFEICEDDTENGEYFTKAFDKAAQFCAYLMEKFPTIKTENIVSHREAALKGYASNHGDPDHWLAKFGKDMNWFRELVRKYSGSETKKIYRVQMGSFNSRANAENYLSRLKKAGFDGFIIEAEK